MEETALQTIAQLGAIGMSALAVVIVTFMVYRTRPNQEVQLQLIGVLKTQGDNALTLKDQLENHDRDSNQRDDKIAEALQGIKSLIANMLAEQQALKLGQSTLLGAVDTMSKTILQTNTMIGEAAKQMTSENIIEKLDRALTILEGIDSKLAAMKVQAEDIAGRLKTAEQDVAAVKGEVQGIKASQTNEHPTVSGSASKTQARRKTDEQEIPAVKPDKPTDTLPTGG